MSLRELSWRRPELINHSLQWSRKRPSLSGLPSSVQVLSGSPLESYLWFVTLIVHCVKSSFASPQKSVFALCKKFCLEEACFSRVMAIFSKPIKCISYQNGCLRLTLQCCMEPLTLSHTLAKLGLAQSPSPPPQDSQGRKALSAQESIYQIEWFTVILSLFYLQQTLSSMFGYLRIWDLPWCQQHRNFHYWTFSSSSEDRAIVVNWLSVSSWEPLSRTTCGLQVRKWMEWRMAQHVIVCCSQAVSMPNFTRL